MRDVRFGWDLLLSLLFNGPGPDCILRRRVKELGTETPYARSSCWPALRTLTSSVCADLIGAWLRSSDHRQPTASCSVLQRPGTRMLMMSLFGVLGLRACRCWNGLVLFGRARRPMTASTRITAV